MRILGKNRLMNAVSVSQNATVYSDSLRFDRSTGDVVVRLKSSAGSITVSQQCSADHGGVWFDPVNASGTAVGTVQTTMTVGDKWITYTPVMAPAIRFKVVENNSAATVVTLDLFLQEDR